MAAPKSIRFLGWDKPALHASADVLIERFRREGVLDGRDAMVVFPGRRAGRRFLEILVERTAEKGLSLIPPAILTLGGLPDVLFRKSRPIAGKMVRRMAWIQALQTADAGDRTALMPRAIASDDLQGWMALADLFESIMEELAGALLEAAKVPETAGRFLPLPERARARWGALAKIERSYLRILIGMGLSDPQEARREAIQEERCFTDRHVILVAAADMSALVRSMLSQVAEKVEVLVHAPERMADHFDEWGCLRIQPWLAETIDIAEDRFYCAEGPAEQAAAVMRCFAEFGKRYTAGDITIGAPEEALVPYLEHQMDLCDIPSHSAMGIPVLQTLPCRLLAAAADCLGHRTFRALATLLRHTDLAFLHAGSDGASGTVCGLDDLDRYHCDHLPGGAGGSWPGNARERSMMKRLHEGCNLLLGDLSQKDRRPLQDWAEPILELLRKVYGDVPLERGDPGERRVVEACEKVQTVLREFQELEASPGPDGRVSSAEALRILLKELSGETVPSIPGEDAVELLGWLELPLDDAPALVITSFNEGFVPRSLSADAFLPDRLRAALGMRCNDRRYTRDAYALKAILNSREEVRIITAQRSVQEEPLSPSRLLFPRNDPKGTAKRVMRLETIFDRPDRVVVHPEIRHGKRSAFGIPKPVRAYGKDYLHVTQFRDYLSSPYGFYLQHVLELDVLDDEPREMSPLVFGTFVHALLHDFGESELRHSSDRDAILNFLVQRLAGRALERFGKDPLPAVQVQLVQLEGRLESFAFWQAGWRQEGWSVLHTEKAFDAENQVPFSWNGEKTMYLRGRVDRIDFNERDGRFAVLDYKTGENFKNPQQVHRRKGRWVDLQLPLYRHLVRALVGEDPPLDLGYIALTKKPASKVCALASWEQAELEEADATAAQVISHIRNGDFDELGEDPPRDVVFQAICGQSLILEPWEEDAT